MRPKSIDSMLMEAMEDAGGQGAMAKLVKKKLETFGDVNLHCSMENGEKNLNLLRNKLRLAASISEVYRVDKYDAQAKKHTERDTNKNTSPVASTKLAEKQGDVSNITKAKIAEILYVDYADNVSLTNHKKIEPVKRLEDKINGNPNDPATASSAKHPNIKEESGEGGSGVKISDEEGGGNVFYHSYN